MDFWQLISPRKHHFSSWNMPDAGEKMNTQERNWNNGVGSFICVCVCAKSFQSCLTLCNSMDRGLSGPSVHGILQPRTLEWVAMPFSSGSSWPRDQTQVSCIAGRFFTVWTTRDILSHPAYVQPLNLARFIFVEEGGNQNTTEHDSWLWRSAVS